MIPTPLPLKAADLRGAARLGFDAFDGVAALVERMHHTITRLPLPLGDVPAGRPRGITGFVYRTVRSVARGVGGAVDLGLALWPAATDAGAVLPQREAALAALNGVWGDHLAATGNPLAITMALRVHGVPLTMDRAGLASALPAATGRVLVMLHGLCMNDLQWSRHGHDHGDVLARAGGFTVLRLHYNSGLHVADNGAQFGLLLEQLLSCWPVPVEDLVLVGHSMGGLVARSAIHQARQDGRAWPGRLGALACLGTPHLGATPERGGHMVDMLFQRSPYVAPFARLSQARSAGITDLRDGRLQATHRRPTPLPEGLPIYLVAATTAAEARGLRHTLVGDGLVSLASAFGEHRDAARALRVPASHKLLVAQAHHWDLLDRPEVAERLCAWLAPPRAAQAFLA
jgi:PGAP1-like protein